MIPSQILRHPHTPAVAMQSLLASLAASRKREFADACGDRVQLHVSADELALTAEQAFALASIAYEAIGNAYAHGFPAGIDGFIALSLNRIADGWVLKVRDNGVGFCTHEHHTSFGLDLMRKSALRLNAALSITPLEGERGTALRLWVPLVMVQSGNGPNTQPKAPLRSLAGRTESMVPA